MSTTEGNLPRALPPPLLWLKGLIPAAVSFLVILLMPPGHRSPYLFAYPAVVLSAWFFGVGAGIVCAIASGALIEYFVFYTHVVPVQPIPQQSAFRLLVFIIGSVVVGWLTQEVSRLRQLNENKDLRRRLERAAAERKLAEERDSAQATVRERETRLQIALEGGHVGLWDHDLENGRILWTDEHYRILGLEPGSVPASYEVMNAAVHRDDREAMQALFHETLAKGEPLYCEYRVVRPDGAVRWVEAQAQYELNAEGKAVRMLGVMTDVTHRKQAEAALLKSEKLAVAGRLAASVAHEINNPLAAVANLLYLITESNSIDDVRAHAQIALSQVMRIARITQQTLKFHRQSEAPRTTRFSDEIDGVLSLFHGRLQQSNIRVDHQYFDDPPLECLSGDLQQVLANLIANALDAMSAGGTLAIRIRRSRDWRRWTQWGMRVTIADSGAGMSPDTLKRIYEPFFTTKTGTGTGLGLWVTSEIIERQQGDLRAWSSRIAGKSGTVFTFFLPIENSTLGIVSSRAENRLEGDLVG
jgi:PAS domain S-box-containing protein